MGRLIAATPSRSLGLLLVAVARARRSRRARPTPTFGTPTIASTFGDAIDLTQPVDDRRPARPGRAPRDVRGRDRSASSSRCRSPRRPGPSRSPTTSRSAATPTCPEHPGRGALAADARRGRRRRSRVPRSAGVYADDRFTWQTLTATSCASTGTRAARRSASGRSRSARRRSPTREQLLGVTEDEPVDFFIYADQASFYDALGPGHPRERRRPGQRRDPDALRAHRAGADRRRVGRRRHPPRARPPRLRHGRRPTRTTSRRAGSTRAWPCTRARATRRADRALVERTPKDGDA